MILHLAFVMGKYLGAAVVALGVQCFKANSA